GGATSLSGVFKTTASFETESDIGHKQRSHHESTGDCSRHYRRVVARRRSCAWFSIRTQAANQAAARALWTRVRTHGQTRRGHPARGRSAGISRKTPREAANPAFGRD